MPTLHTFSKPEEAQLLRSRLEVAGIPALVRDEFTIQMNWLYSTALGGVRVEVPDEYLEAAREIMRLPPVESESERVTCPRCASSQVVRKEWPRKVAYLSLLVLGFPLLFSRKLWKCGTCRFTWR